MTAIVTTPRSLPARILNVVKLNLANPWTIVLMPWLVLTFIFALNYAIWWIIAAAAGSNAMAETSEGLQYSGASGFIFVYMLVVAVQAMNQTFFFALGFGVTRRDFYLGTAATLVGVAALFAAGIALLGEVERLTNGWGLGGRMFSVVYFGDGMLERFYITFALFVFFSFTGTIFAAVFARWKANGLVTAFAVLALMLLGIAALITFTNSWPAVGEWFVRNGPRGVATWSLPVSLLAALAGYALLRRATPRN